MRGACSAEDEGAACQYDSITGCLCQPNVVGSFTPCQKVDPLCPQAPAPAPADGAGGFSGKVAPPVQSVCTCTAPTGRAAPAKTTRSARRAVSATE